VNRAPSLFVLLCLAGFLSGCGNSRTQERKESQGERIYVTNEGSGDLSVIDAEKLEVIATVPLGKRPRGIHASPDRRTIYIALSGSPFAGPGVDESKLPPPDRSADGIGVFDVQQNKLLKVMKSGNDPEQFALSRDGKLLYVSNEDAATASIFDLASEKVAQALPVGSEPEGVTMTPDGKFVYVTSEGEGALFVIDARAGKVVKNFKVGHRARSVAFLPDGSRAYVTCEVDNLVAVVDAVRQELIKTIPLGGKQFRPMGVVVSPDGSQVYVSSGGGHRVFAISTATDQITGSIEVGQRPWGIALSGDGKKLYTANGPSNDVSVVDLAKQAVIKKIKVGDRPYGVLVLSP
jgi:YVTN family beta-propeller protein